MITNTEQLNVALYQLSCFADMLEAMRLHCEKKNSALFPHISEAYIHRIRELNEEIRQYLQANPDAAAHTSESPLSVS